MFSIAAFLMAAALPVSAQLDAVPQTRLDPQLRCLLGVYKLPKRKSVTITGLDGEQRALHYTLSNGQFGRLKENSDSQFSDGALTMDFAPCHTRTLTLTLGNIEERGERLRLMEKETSFENEGVALHGKLVLPDNGHADSLAVWIDGSNNDPSTDDNVWQYELAKRGVATFVYDKRGTGASSGSLTADFNIRARDTVAAIQEARRLAPKIRRVGVIGGSQGGWVAPLTATLTPLDFVIPAFAMAEGPIAQDRELVEMQLRKAGFDDTVLRTARELTRITERIVRSNMAEGFAELDAFKSSHANAEWLNAIQPRSFTGLFIRFPTEQLKAIGPTAAQGLSFEFEPRPIIETIKPRQLWLLGGQDSQAPNAETQTILRQLQKKRRDIAVILFPDAEHGLIEEVKTSDGVTQRYPTRLFDLTADWIRTGRLPGKERFLLMPAHN